jgi:transcriptional antiterminator NusG
MTSEIENSTVEAAPEAETASNAAFKWYVVHTYSGYEEKAKTTLLDRIKNNHCEAKFGKIVIPTSTKETVSKTGKKKQVSKTQFPGYILVEMEFDEETMVLVKDTPRITGFIGANQRNPRPLPDNEVLRLLNPGAAKQDSVKEQPDVLFEKGESVKVTDGPFTNFDGIVDEVKPDKARLRVLVSIFGRETPVELEYKQVQKLS